MSNMMVDLATDILHGDYVAAFETLEDMTPEDYMKVDNELKMAIKAEDIEKSTIILHAKYPDIYKAAFHLCIRFGCGYQN